MKSVPVPPEGDISRIAIVDNDRQSLSALRALVEERLERAAVVWTADNGRDALERYRDDEPDLMLLDMSMEDIQGPSICRRIRLDSGERPILAITSFSLHRYRSKAFAAGAQGLVSKNDEDELVDAMRGALSGRVRGGFESPLIAHMRVCNEAPLSPRLTLREEEIINLTADDGLIDREIAEELGISEATVRKHLQNIMRKLGARTTRQAVAAWLSPRNS